MFPFPGRPSAFPQMAHVTVTFPRPRIEDLSAAVRAEVARLPLPDLTGRRVTVTAGSRGIRDIVPILRNVVAEFQARGAQVELVAAMGSHGGGTAEGQRRLLEHLGITPASIGVPIVSSMEVVEVGRTSGGLVAYCDRYAAGSDGIFVVNRIKPHTAFAEPFGSGLLKMIAVGLAKAPGAAQIHRQGPARMGAAIADLAAVTVSTGKILGGLAILENAYDETARLDGVEPRNFLSRELELFVEARAMMPHLPVEDLDVLIVDEVGKNYSGTGMDVNVIGRWRLPEMPEPSSPRIKRIVALRLSPQSEGNAQGIGLADVITRRLADAIDPVSTYVNNLVSTYLQRAFIPITMPTDEDAVALAIASLSLSDARATRIARIRNTLHLDELWLSEPALPDLHGHAGIRVDQPKPLAFDSDGMFVDLSS
jgi:hypothetical protein